MSSDLATAMGDRVYARRRGGIISRHFPTFVTWWRGLGWPILAKQLRVEFRRDRFVWLHGICLAGQALSLLLVIGSGVDDPTVPPGQIGQQTFDRFLLLQAFVVVFIFPAFSATALSEEKRTRSLDLLLLSTLRPVEVVWGKLLAAAFYCLVCVGSALPLLAVSFVFGGIDVREVLFAYAGLLVLTILVTMLGIAVSSFCESSVRATLSTYGIIAIALALLSFAFEDAGTGGEGPGTIIAQLEAKWSSAGTAGARWAELAFHTGSAFVALFLIAASRIRPPGDPSGTGLRLLAMVYVPGAILTGAVWDLLVAGSTVAPSGARDLEGAVEWATCALLLACVIFSTESPILSRRTRKIAAARRGIRRVAGIAATPGALSGFVFSVVLASAAVGSLIALFVLRHPSEPLPAYLREVAWTLPLYVAFVGAIGLFLAETGFTPRQARLTLVSLLVLTWVLPAIFLVSDVADRFYHGMFLSPPVLWSSLDHIEEAPRIGNVTFRVGGLHLIVIARIAYALGAAALFSFAMRLRAKRKHEVTATAAETAGESLTAEDAEREELTAEDAEDAGKKGEEFTAEDAEDAEKN
ncbi:MAG TPA: ABC transporter permease [Planctomycetota bacterium]|nr:ABC transporter permease [Planctomycetota bacterium]